MSGTEDHLRAMLADRAGRVDPGPVPDDLLTEAGRPSRRTRVPALLAAAAVVVVVAGAALLPHLGGDGPAPTPTQPSHALLPATAQHPVAGACGRSTGSVVTIRIEPDTPFPRCTQVRAHQSLRVVNRTADYGQRAHAVRVRWIPGHPVRLAPGASTTFRRPFGDYLARGVHVLRTTPAYAAEIWLH